VFVIGTNSSCSTAWEDSELVELLEVVVLVLTEWELVEPLVEVLVKLLDVVVLVVLEWVLVEVLEVTVDAVEVCVDVVEVCVEALDVLVLLVVEELEDMDGEGSVTWMALGMLTATGDAVFPET
jgi:hypothetical protein